MFGASCHACQTPSISENKRFSFKTLCKVAYGKRLATGLVSNVSIYTRRSPYEITRVLRAPLRLQCRAYTTQHDEGDNPMFTRSELPKPKLDYASIIQHLDTRISNALARKAPIDVSAVSSLPTLYFQYKDHLRSITSIRAEQNTLGREIQRVAKAKDTQKRDELLDQAKSLKSRLLDNEKTLNGLEHRLLSLSLTFPNDTHPQSPVGPESNAKLISTHGPTPLPPSPSRNHLSISKKFNLLDFESGAIVTGRSWYYLLNEAAILEMALVNYAMSVAIQAGFVPVITPDAVRADIAARCGFAPREPGGAASQMYHITNHLTPSLSQSPPELVLSGTAEIPLAGLFANGIYPSDQLPLKYVGVGRSFRSEAGASAESRGLYRVHQFTKVELFAVTPEDQSEEMMERTKDIQKNILEGLGLPFRYGDCYSFSFP